MPSLGEKLPLESEETHVEARVALSACPWPHGQNTKRIELATVATHRQRRDISVTSDKALAASCGPKLFQKRLCFTFIAPAQMSTTYRSKTCTVNPAA